MIRRAAATVLALLLGFIATLNADEIQGTIRKVNAGQNSITVSVKGKDTSYSVSKEASFVTVSTVMGKKNKTTEQVKPIDNGLAGLKVGATATLLTDRVDEKEIVTSVKVSDSANNANQNLANNAANPKKKKKKNNKNK